MAKDKGIACPHCGLIREQPLGHCPLCIEPGFRAETARMLFAGWMRSGIDAPATNTALAFAAVAAADALIAELAKERTCPTS